MPARSLPLALIGSWFCLVLLAAWSGAFASTDASQPPLLIVAVVLPVVAFLLAYATSAAVRAFVLSRDLAWLTVLQSWRVAGFAMLPLYAVHALPASFALPAGVGDVLVGFSAPFLAATIVDGRPTRPRLFVAWTVFGMLDLVTAVTLGALNSPSSIGLLAGDVTTAPMARLPMSLIPTFGVPFTLIVHIASLLQLRAREAERPALRLAAPASG